MSDGTNTYTYRTTGNETDAAALARAIVDDFTTQALNAGTAAKALKDQIQSLKVDSSAASHIAITGLADGTPFTFSAKALDANKVGRIVNDDQTLRQRTTKLATPITSFAATDDRSLNLAGLTAVAGQLCGNFGKHKISYTAQATDTADDIISRCHQHQCQCQFYREH